VIQAINGETVRQSRQVVKNKGTGRSQWRIDYLGTRTPTVEDRPHIFLVEMDPGGSIRPHFHQVDQFQVFVSGSGSLGRNAVPLITLHYADHHTAYGPIAAGPFGLSLFTIRAKCDTGSIYVDEPGYKELLKPTKKRYLLKESVALSTEPVLQSRSEVALENLLEGADVCDGLGAFILRLGAGMKSAGPDPSTSGGHCYLVVNGSLQLDGASYPVWSIIHANSTDAALELVAGPQGLEMIMFSFPRSET
jgi:hypothetical protein